MLFFARCEHLIVGDILPFTKNVPEWLLKVFFFSVFNLQSGSSSSLIGDTHPQAHNGMDLGQTDTSQQATENKIPCSFVFIAHLGTL